MFHNFFVGADNPPPIFMVIHKNSVIGIKDLCAYIGAENFPPLPVENAGFKRFLVQKPALNLQVGKDCVIISKTKNT